MATDSSAAFDGPATGPGYLLFLRQRALMAQRFDPGKLEMSGEAFPVAEPVGVETGFWRARFSVSESGVLVYDSGGGGNRQLVWMDRGGKRLETVGPPGAYWQLDLSPDGQRVAAMRSDPQTGDSDIWLFDVVRAASSRFTFHPAVEGIPVWSHDGSRIAFYSTRDGPWNLYQKAASGTGEDESLLKTQADKMPTDWSRDGRFLLFGELDAKTGADLWVLPLTAETKDAGRKPMPFLRTEYDERNGRFSPDGKWVAYDSNESGRYEVYVREFLPGQPGSGGKWPVSTGGGVEPRWRGDGKELFYLAPDRKLMAVEVNAGSGFQAGRPWPLFQTSAFTGTHAGRYAVTADGQRCLINSEAEEAAGEPATVILNWTAALVSSWRSRAFFKREESADTFSLHLMDGLPELKSRMQALLKDGIIFRNCIFTGHGNSGVIWLGSDTITRRVWYRDFYDKGYDRLFPFKNARLYFAGCNVAEDPHGWAFLEAAARSLLKYAGGSAFGWTSAGFGSPFSGHERHLWGDTKAVMVSAGGDYLRYFRNWNLITDDAGLPIRPEEASDPTGY